MLKCVYTRNDTVRIQTMECLYTNTQQSLQTHGLVHICKTMLSVYKQLILRIQTVCIHVNLSIYIYKFIQILRVYKHVHNLYTNTCQFVDVLQSVYTNSSECVQTCNGLRVYKLMYNLQTCCIACIRILVSVCRRAIGCVYTNSCIICRRATQCVDEFL